MSERPMGLREAAEAVVAAVDAWDVSVASGDLAVGLIALRRALRAPEPDLTDLYSFLHDRIYAHWPLDGCTAAEIEREARTQFSPVFDAIALTATETGTGG